MGLPLGLRLGTFTQHAPRPLRCDQAPPTTSPSHDGPTISIVTPSFNQGYFLGQTIRSVLDQHYPKLQYYIQDACSTDTSLDVLRKYEDRLTGWVSEPDNGQADAINRGFAKTSGQVMAWLNSDDRLLPGSLEAVARCFEKRSEIDVVYGHRVIVDAQGYEVGRWVTPQHRRGAMIWADYVPQETMFWRRSLWDRVGGRVNDKLQFSMDWDLVARFEQAGARFYRIPRFIGVFTTHPSQKSIATKESIGRHEFEQIRSQYAGRGLRRLGYRLQNYTHLARSIGYYWGYRSGLLRY